MDVLKILNYNWLINFGLIQFDENYKNITPETKKLFWLPDNLSQNCFHCDTKFSLLLNRQHHCRICGNIFCSNCTSKQIQFIAKDQNNNEKLIKVKVCHYCFIISVQFDNYIINNIIKNMNKFHYFCKYIEVSKKNNEKFLEIENWQKENEIKKNIDNTYDIIIQNLIRNVLNEYFNDNIVLEWKNSIYKIIIEIINNLRNSYLFLDDKLDINKYIKIKLIDYKNNSLSEAIPGLVIKINEKKNYLNTNLINPKLLLINIENNTLINKLNNSSNNYFKRNTGYINIILQKIILNNPDVILIGKNYPKIFYNDLINNSSMKNKFIFFDIKKKHLEQISRTTANIILSSINLIGIKNPFNKCKKFYIKDMKNYSLLVFEGESPILFNSIILSGNNKLFLKKLKMILRNILIPSARDLYLQKYLIYAFNMDVNNKSDNNIINNILQNNKKIRPDQINQKNIYTTFEIAMNKINNNLKNNFNIKRNNSYEKKENILKIKEGQIIQNKKKSNINNKENIINNCFYNGFDLSLICKKKEYINFSLLKFAKIINEIKCNNNIINDNINQIIDEENSLDEKEIQRQYKYCKANSKKIFFSFFSYNKSHDQSIFQFFYDFFKFSKNICKNCNEPFNKHLYQYYKIDGKFSIKFITDKEYDLDKIISFIEKKGYFKSENLALLFNIYTYGYCNICKKIVTPLFRFNNEILNYSTAKLFRLLLENLNMKNNNREYNYNIKEITDKKNICNHIINKNISRIFITEHGSCVFDYKKIIKYFIDPININVEIESNSNIDINNNLKLNNATYNIYNNDNFILIEQISSEALNNTKIVLDIINELFQEQIKASQNLMNKKKLDLFNANITSLINIIILSIKLIDTFKNNILKYMTKEYLQENDKDLYILKYIIIIKKIYVKIIQTKYISNIIERYINKIKIISDILYNKIPYSYDGNAKLPNKIEIPLVLQKLENKKEYLNMIHFIEYYDNGHNILDIENIKDDLSNIISNTLSSDDYINFIDGDLDNIKYTKIKCKRINNTNLNEDEIKKNILNKKNNMLYLDKNELFENSLKLFDINNNTNNKKINNININTKILENSSILYNLEKNKFSLKEENDTKNKQYEQTEEENKRILEYLKKELLSLKKEEFNFSIVNDLSNLFKIFNINNSSSFVSTKSEKITNENIDDYFKEEDSEEEKEREKEKEKERKENSSDSKSININIFELIRQDINEINDEIININNNLNDFDKAFIDNQRQLNTLIKNSISKQKHNINLSLNSSKKNLFSIFSRSRKNSHSSNDSNDSNDSKSSKNSQNSKKIKISEHNRLSLGEEYKEIGARSFKLNSDSLSKLNDNDNNDNNFLPKFEYMPEFLKIFELKKINFLEDKLISQKYPEYEIKVFYPRQFQALRTLYFSENFESFIFSSKQSEDWEISGGKSKANFFRTLDEKFAIKNISELEFNMLIDSAFNYFQHLSKFFFEKKPTLLAKIFGAFQIKVKSPKEKEKNYYLIYMENIYYNKISRNNFDNFNTVESNLKVYDLKGSEINRYIRPKNKKKGKILLDTNYIEDSRGEPLFLEFDNFKILNQALLNDCFFLKKESIIDYSLLIIYEINNDNENEFEIKKIRMGIIDYLRKYTWDKQIESYGKKLIHGFANPTIINPENYSERFIDKIKTYFSSV